MLDFLEGSCLEVHVRVSQDASLAGLVCLVPLVESVAPKQVIKEGLVDDDLFLVVSEIVVFVSGAEHRVETAGVESRSCPPLNDATIGECGRGKVKDYIVKHVNVDDSASEVTEHVCSLIMSLK